jgi:hypothetical protein
MRSRPPPQRRAGADRIATAAPRCEDFTLGAATDAADDACHPGRRGLHREPADFRQRVRAAQRTRGTRVAASAARRRSTPARILPAVRRCATACSAAANACGQLLVYAAGEALGAPATETLDDARRGGRAHPRLQPRSHDDLPAMDDDDLRRGRPTCHRAFDEAHGDPRRRRAPGARVRRRSPDRIAARSTESLNARAS